jgi:hypothetical protein
LITALDIGSAIELSAAAAKDWREASRLDSDQPHEKREEARLTEPDKDLGEEPAVEGSDAEEDVELHGGGKKGGGLGGGATMPVEPPAPE